MNSTSQLRIEDKRIVSLDILRGIVMILMAIDHVRVYSGLPSGSPEPALFFTRWVTHFCAPAFAFLAGTSAWLYGLKVNNLSKLRNFLLTRGLLLILLEFTLIKFFWTFKLDYSKFNLAGVIWMLGCSMVFLALLVKLKPLTIGIIGLLIIFGQRLFGYVPLLLPGSARQDFGKVWEFIYSSGLDGPNGITILYVLVPWIGVMAAGYAFGVIMIMEAKKRNSICLKIGLSAIALFIVIGSIIVTQSAGPKKIPFLIKLLNQQKYPASELFLLMTLGPLIALVPLAERMKGWWAKTLSVFGRVPMFYYLVHIPLIHGIALIVNKILYGSARSHLYDTAPYVGIKKAERWSLGTLYIVFMISVILLYFACNYYMKYRERNRQKIWLRYI